MTDESVAHRRVVDLPSAEEGDSLPAVPAFVDGRPAAHPKRRRLRKLRAAEHGTSGLPLGDISEFSR